MGPIPGLDYTGLGSGQLLYLSHTYLYSDFSRGRIGDVKVDLCTKCRVESVLNNGSLHLLPTTLDNTVRICPCRHRPVGTDWWRYTKQCMGLHHTKLIGFALSVCVSLAG